MIRRWDKSKPSPGPFTLNRDAPQAQGLVAWWPFGGVSGTAFVADRAGNYHLTPGTAPGSMTRLQSGAPGAVFTAASSQHFVGSPPVTALPLTLSAWGQTDGSTQTAMQIVSDAATINDFCRIVLVSNKVRANVGTHTGGSQSHAVTTASYTNGKLHLFSASFASATSRTVYLDGGNAVTDTTSITPTTAFTRLRFATALTIADVILQPWNGSLGESGVWNVALSADMHARLYNEGTRFELWYPLRSRKWMVAAGGGGDVSVALSGQAVTASAGTLTPSASLALAGHATTASTGTLTPSGTVPLSGQAATISAGTITYNASSDITVALSGQAVTASTGTLAPSRTIAQTGQAVTASAGTVAHGLSKAATGEQITTSTGTLTLGIVVPLSGQSVTANTGTIAYSADGAISIALTGSAVTASAGTLVPARTVAATGSAIAVSAGTIVYNTAGDVTVALSGQAVAVSAGTLTALGAFREGNPLAWIVDSRQRYVQVDARLPEWRI